jgi:hypothetical protein
MAVNIPTTACSDELFALLRQIDISVPGRTQKRTTHHAETYTICHLLSTLGAAGRLTFPASLEHRDKPDFLLEDAGKSIGIEVTEAISQQYAAYCALAEREFPSALLELGHFRWDSPERTAEEMRALLRQRKLTSEGWAGNAPEREWALFIQSAVDNKLAKLARPDFAKFDCNWLSIYDNLPMPNIHLGDAITLLRSLLQDRWSQSPRFDALLVEHGPVIAYITAAGSEHLLLEDLWASAKGTRQRGTDQ